MRLDHVAWITSYSEAISVYTVICPLRLLDEIVNWDGYMFAAGMNPDRPAWKDGNKPTDTEKLRAIEGFFAYYGRYEIDEAKQLFLQCAFRRCQHFFGLLCRQHCSIAGLTHALLT